MVPCVVFELGWARRFGHSTIPPGATDSRRLSLAAIPRASIPLGPTPCDSASSMEDFHPPRDTCRAADEAQLEALRRMGPAGRLRAGLRFSRSMIALSRAALRARHPELDEQALRLLWIEQNYGAALARAVERHQKAVGWTSTTISPSALTPLPRAVIQPPVERDRADTTRTQLGHRYTSPAPRVDGSWPCPHRRGLASVDVTGNTGSSMSAGAADWIHDFLRCRTLEHPDGRALYAYRCTAREFAGLTETLERNAPLGNRAGNGVIRAFVLYAAEWWQRRYDGRHWAWEPLLTSIGWYSVDYPELYESVRKAWSWWKVDLVRLPTSIRYLGTFACQGGLPLALVGDTDSRVTQYLRAVLKHTAAYRQFVDDPIDLARDQQHLLNPPTLRRDYVFRLAADLIEAVLDLQNDIESDSEDEDPLNALDQGTSGLAAHHAPPLWKMRGRAALLTGLLREAAQGRLSPSDEFRVERFLRRTDVGWRLGARIRLPASVSADHFARQLRVPAAARPRRLEMRLQGERVRVVGLYVRQSDDFRTGARCTKRDGIVGLRGMWRGSSSVSGRGRDRRTGRSPARQRPGRTAVGLPIRR